MRGSAHAPSEASSCGPADAPSPRADTCSIGGRKVRRWVPAWQLRMPCGPRPGWGPWGALSCPLFNSSVLGELSKENTPCRVQRHAPPGVGVPISGDPGVDWGLPAWPRSLGPCPVGETVRWHLEHVCVEGAGADGPPAPTGLFLSVPPSPVGEVLPVLAGPGLLDLWKHPRVRGGLRGSGGLHHPEVLHTVRKRVQLPPFWKDSFSKEQCRESVCIWLVFDMTSFVPTPGPQHCSGSGCARGGGVDRSALVDRGQEPTDEGTRRQVPSDSAGCSWARLTVLGGGSWVTCGGHRDWGFSLSSVMSFHTLQW